MNQLKENHIKKILLAFLRLNIMNRLIIIQHDHTGFKVNDLGKYSICNLCKYVKTLNVVQRGKVSTF